MVLPFFGYFKVWYIVFVCQFQSFLSNYMVSHCHILLVYVHKQFVNNFVYKLVLSFAQILLFSSELTWLILLDNNRLVLIQYVKVFRGTAGMLFLLEPFSRSRNNFFFFFDSQDKILVQSSCPIESIITKTNKSVNTVYNLFTINTIQT